MTFQTALTYMLMLCTRYQILTGAWGRAVQVHADDISGLDDDLPGCMNTSTSVVGRKFLIFFFWIFYLIV